MYIRLIVEKRVKINGRTDRFGTGGKSWLPVLVRTQSTHCPELLSGATRDEQLRRSQVELGVSISRGNVAPITCA
jgi:hypothetical protein